MDNKVGNWSRTSSIKKTELTGFLGDIESRLPERHPYKDRDKMTWGHEGTHGINSRLRNGLQNYNAAYLLGSWAYFQNEPATTLSLVKQNVPANLRGGVFDLYLIEQQRYWNNQPLYILDEFSAYTNSVFVGHELEMSNDRVGYAFEKGVELWGYLEVLNKIESVGCIEFCRLRISAMCDLGRDKWYNNYQGRQIDNINEYIRKTTN